MNGHVQDELAALVAGELSPSAAAAVHAHLATCDRCRVELAAVAFATGELRSAARLPFADPDELPPLRLAVTEAERVGPAVTVLAATDDGLDPAYQATRQAAFAVAARRAPGWCCSTAPRAVPGRPVRAGPGERRPEEFAAQPAHRRPRRPAYLAEQLAEVSRLGLDGAAWVARGHGPEALAAACEVLDAERVVLPATLATPPLIDRVRGHTLAAFRRRVPARITLADLDGTLAEVD